MLYKFNIDITCYNITMFKKKWMDKIKQNIPKFIKKGYNVNILHNSIILYFMLLISIINLNNNTETTLHSNFNRTVHELDG